jgi:hypothetical protein
MVVLQPGSPVINNGPYGAYSVEGREVGSYYLPAGCYSPVIAGVAYFALIGVSRADC